MARRFRSGDRKLFLFHHLALRIHQNRRDLFILLGQSEEGSRLFYTLVTLMNRYSKGVIIEGVETASEWAMVCNSDALAAQGYYLARPTMFDNLDNLPIHFKG